MHKWTNSLFIQSIDLATFITHAGFTRFTFNHTHYAFVQFKCWKKPKIIIVTMKGKALFVFKFTYSCRIENQNSNFISSCSLRTYEKKKEKNAHTQTNGCQMFTQLSSRITINITNCIPSTDLDQLQHTNNWQTFDSKIPLKTFK